MMFRPTSLLLVALLALSLPVYSQVSQVRFEHLSLRDGLSQSAVSCVLQDSRGFMWFGTQDGLNRYDGFGFTVFQHDSRDTTTISDNDIRTILEDSKGNIWIGTDNGVNRYDPQSGRFSQLLIDRSQRGERNPVNVLALSPDGTIWVATASHGIRVINPSPIATRQHQHLADFTIPATALYADHENQLWIGTATGGLWLQTKDQLIEFSDRVGDAHSIPDHHIHAITTGPKGRIWIGTNRGAALCERLVVGKNSAQFVSVTSQARGGVDLSALTVTDISTDHTGAVWLATQNGGVVKLTQATATTGSTVFKAENFRHYASAPHSLASNQVNSIFEDRGQTMWIGTANGISKLDPYTQAVKHYMPAPDNSAANNVWSIRDGAEGFWWVGTSEALRCFDPKQQTWTRNEIYDNVGQPAAIYSLTEDHEGNLLVGAQGGLHRIKKSKGVLGAGERIRGYQLPANRVESHKAYYAIEDAQKRLWVATNDGLLLVHNNKETLYRYSAKKPDGLANDVVHTILEDSKGRIWIGTEGGLQQVIVEDGVITRFITYQHNHNVPNSLSNDLVFSLWEDEAGTLWLGTYGGGLNRFNESTGNFKAWTERDGLANNVIYGVLGDVDGYLWLSTNKGLTRFDPRTETIRNYDVSDGLQSDEFNTGAYSKNRRGELFFGGINGFNHFDPVAIRSNTVPPQVVLTDFQLYNQTQLPGISPYLTRTIGFTDKVVLSWKEDHLTFEFAALHFSSPHKNSYAYKLVGFEDEWNEVGNRRLASYTNLDPGQYTFLVKASNSDGVWSEQVAQVDLKIVPPYWATWWFRIGAMLFAVLFIYLLWIMRIKSIKAQKMLLHDEVARRTEEVLHQKDLIEQQKALLEVEKEKSEKLLLNLLPEETVDELKYRGKAIARHYRSATVMFTDFQGFTKISEKMKPIELVAQLDSFFVKFDEIIAEHNIEKIKTMGDAYMCAGGIPIRNRSNAIDVVLAGLEIKEYMEQLRDAAEVKEDVWQLRIGIHTGPIIAGVIGIKRFAYDIWGDTVNIASRMETASTPGKVNISGKTFNKIKDFFVCEHRGMIMAKNKGEVNMYFVNRIRPEFSANDTGTRPNERFWEYVNLQLYSSINYMKAERYILSRLRQELSKDLHYHSIAHTRDVCEQVERIARDEDIKGESLFLLKTAALYHDAGFVRQYRKNEPLGAAMAREVLPRYGYTAQQIDLICELILATAVPQKPTNKLQQVLCDADLDYLGRDDFNEISERLYNELRVFGDLKSHRDWDEIQINFLESHRYFTPTNIRERQEKKRAHLEAIKKRFEENAYP